MWKSPTSAWGKPKQNPDKPRSSAQASGGCAIAWLLPQTLAFGSLPQPEDSLRFHEQGIHSILTLCAASEGEVPVNIPQQFAWLRLALPDSRHTNQPNVPQMMRVVHHIHTQISQGSTIYVHCLAGIERSPAACIAYLCQYHKLELWEAIHHVKQVRPQVLLSNLQLQTIRHITQQPSELH